MRIFINKKLDNKSGPVLFTARLFDCLKERFPVQIVGPNDKPDITFCVISFNKKSIPSGSKIVTRIDGLYWNLLDKKIKMNSEIFASVRASDGVVFQSEFCRKCYEHNLGKTPLSTVILNAIDHQFIQSVTPANLPKDSIIACARWRPTKRPSSICRSFIASKVPHHLFMVGEPPANPIKHKKITWLGNQNTSTCISLMKACSHAIHLAKFDPCPNAVVEEVSCGLPVLHTSNGGTPEIVQGNGLCIPIDQNWNFEPLKQEIDNLDPEYISRFIEQLITIPRYGSRPDLNIEKAAQKYYEFFCTVLEK